MKTTNRTPAIASQEAETTRARTLNVPVKRGMPESLMDVETKKAKTSSDQLEVAVSADSKKEWRMQRDVRPENAIKVIRKEVSPELIKPASSEEDAKIKVSIERAHVLGVPYVLSSRVGAVEESHYDGFTVAENLFEDKTARALEEENPVSWQKGIKEHRFFCVLPMGHSLIPMGTIEYLQNNGVNEALCVSVLCVPRFKAEEHEEMSNYINKTKVIFSVLLGEGLVLPQNLSASKSLLRGMSDDEVEKTKADLLVLCAGSSPNHFLKALLRSGVNASIRSGEFGVSPVVVANRFENVENLELLKSYGAVEWDDSDEDF